MSFWQQLRDAFRGQIEDFFRVSPGAVALMLVVVAVLILHAGVRIAQGGAQFFGWQGALLCVVWLLLRFMRR